MQTRKVVFVALFGVLANLYSVVGAEEVFPANQRAIDDMQDFDCIIEPGEVVDVGSAVSGIIEQVYVDIGDAVELGMPLSKLNSSVEQAALKLAKAKAAFTGSIEAHKENAAYSLRSKTRNQRLYSKSAISLQEIDQLETELRVAQIQVRQAKNAHQIAELDYLRTAELFKQRTILSPISGVVVERFNAAGEFVKDKPLMRLAQLDPLKVEIIVPVEYMRHIPIGLQAEVTPIAPGYGKQLATVERIDRVADTASGTFGVRLSLPNPDKTMPGGLRCQLSFLSEENIEKTESIDSTTVDSVPEKTTKFSIEQLASHTTHRNR